MKEIERKFLIKDLPNLKDINPIRYERYFLNNDDNDQVRIQKRDNKFELETKVKISNVEYHKTKKEISEKEFLDLSRICTKEIIRESYLILPNITIKKYFGDYEGLVRAEIEYDVIEQLENIELPDWVGKEITGTELANDSKLIKLSRAEFLEKLSDYIY